MQTINIGSNSYSLCTIPTSPGASEIEIGMNDAVAVFTSPFTGSQQTQQFPGGDNWDATITLPPMYYSQAAPWEGFLAELRGKLNVFQLGDTRTKTLLGVGTGTPVVNTSGSNNLAMTTSLFTSGWTHSTTGLLLPNDKFQIGYRLYKVAGSSPVNSDSSGNATIQVWPSLRETPANGTPIILNSPVGIFRLASNRRAIHWSPTRLTTVSLACVEAR